MSCILGCGEPNREIQVLKRNVQHMLWAREAHVIHGMMNHNGRAQEERRARKVWWALAYWTLGTLTSALLGRTAKRLKHPVMQLYEKILLREVPWYRRQH